MYLKKQSGFLDKDDFQCIALTKKAVASAIVVCGEIQIIRRGR